MDVKDEEAVVVSRVSYHMLLQSLDGGVT